MRSISAAQFIAWREAKLLAARLDASVDVLEADFDFDDFDVVEIERFNAAISSLED